MVEIRPWFEINLPALEKQVCEVAKKTYFKTLKYLHLFRQSSWSLDAGTAFSAQKCLAIQNRILLKCQQHCVHVLSNISNFDTDLLEDDVIIIITTSQCQMQLH